MTTIREPRPMKPAQGDAAMSREGKWTPGPWLQDGKLVYALTDYLDPHAGPVRINRFSAGLQTQRHANCPDSELVANASLIAAAPQMAEALRLCLIEHERMSKHLDVSEDTPGMRLARAALRAAGVEP